MASLLLAIEPFVLHYRITSLKKESYNNSILNEPWNLYCAYQSQSYQRKLRELGAKKIWGRRRWFVRHRTLSNPLETPYRTFEEKQIELDIVCRNLEQTKFYTLLNPVSILVLTQIFFQRVVLTEKKRTFSYQFSFDKHFQVIKKQDSRVSCFRFSRENLSEYGKKIKEKTS